MGLKQFRTETFHPNSLVLGNKTISGILSASDTLVDSDEYLMATDHINALIDAKGSPHIQASDGSVDNYIHTDGTKYRTVQPWAIGEAWSGSAQNYGGYAEMLPMYISEDTVIRGFQYQCYNGSTNSGDDYLYMCFYEADNGADNAANFRNFPNALVGYIVLENPDGASSGYVYYSSVPISNQGVGDMTTNTDSKIYNASGTAVSSLSLTKGHYWCVTTASISATIWGSWSYNHRLIPRIFRLGGQSTGYASNGYKINPNQSSYNPDYAGGQWLTTWAITASGRNDGSWTPPNPFDVDDGGNASASQVASAFQDYYNVNYPNVKLLCDGLT